MALVDDDHTILATSSRLGNMGDVVGKKCCQVFHSQGAASKDCALRRAAGGQTAEEEIFDSSTGKWWSIKVIPLHSNGAKRYLYLIEDITATRGLEHGLMQSQANFRTIFDGAADAMFILDVDGTALVVNDAACAILGQERGALIGQTLEMFAPNGSCPLVEQHADILTKGSARIEMAYTNFAGRTLQLEVDLRMMPMGGRMVLVTSARDISVRKETEKRMKLNEERLQALFEQAGMAIAQIDLDGRFMEVNEQFLRLTGFRRQDLIGEKVFRFLVQTSEEGIDRSIERLQRSEIGTLVTERQLRRSDSSHSWVRINTSAVRESTDRINYIVSIIEDIDQGKRAEESLRRSEARFRSLVHNSMDITAVLSLDGVISYISPSSLRLLGYSPEEELVGNSLFSLLHPEDIARVRSTFDRLIKDPLITAAPEFRLRCADGRYAYYEGVGTNLLAEPSVAGLVINARDISERKRSEEVLKRRDEILEAVSLVSERLIRGASWEDNIQDVIETLGEATQVHRARIYEMLEGDHGSKNVYLRYEWTMPSFSGGKGPRGPDGFDLRKMGLSKWEDTLLIGGIVQANLMDLHYPGRGLLESQGVQSMVVVPILAGYELWGYIDLEDMLRERNWTSIEIDALRAATSTLGSAILRERASRDLETEKERLAVTLRSIADGVITTDIHGDIVLMNNAAEEMLGYTQAEVEGQPVRRVFRLVKDARTGEANPVYRVLKSGERVEMESHIILGREQSRTTIEDSAAPIRDRSSRVIGAVLVFRDVTARKAMEEELVKSQRLESVGVLAGGIAHDFNNIMTAILGNIALAKSWCRPGDRVMDKLMETEKATLRARDLTQQLLTFSKGGAPIRQAASVSEILHDTIDFSLSGSNILPHYALPVDLWAVNIDPGQISQVLDNLIANSKDAMPDGGTLEIVAQNVKLAEGENPAVGSGKYVKLSLRDQGVGIPHENLNKIFEPYFTTKSKGTGLGLAVVYSVIAKHEGHIDVESEVGKGTTFHILLPATPESGAGRKDGKESIIRGQGRVLLMDDEEFILEVTGEVLRTLGYQVELARDGEEAVRMYQTSLSEGRRYDAVIMDLTIPGGMGGKEAIKELLKIDPLVKAIVSSGYSSDATMADHCRFGFSGVIPKPYKIEDLSRIMSETIRG